MAKRKSRGDAPIQRGFDFDVPVAQAAAPAPRPRRRVKRAPSVTVSVETMDPAALAAAWAEANKAEGGSAEYLEPIAAIRLSMLVGAFGVPGEPVTFDWHGRLVNGRKIVRAADELGFPLKVPVVRGIDPRNRFAIDDATPRNRRRIRRRDTAAEGPQPAAVPAVAEGGSTAARMLDLLARAAIAAGKKGVPLPVRPPSEAEARASVDASRPAAGTSRFPHHLLALVHLLASRHDGGRGPRDFMNVLAMPLLATASAPARLAQSERRDGRPGDEAEVDLLVTCALAWGLFRAGKAADPYLWREEARALHDDATILGAFLSPQQAVPEDASAVAWSIETLDEADIAGLLAASGRPVDAWDPEDVRKLTHLTADALEGGGLRLCGQCIKVREDGSVEDGVGRLMASHVARLPLRAVVARGFPAGWSSQARQGRRQSYGHRNMSERVTNPYDLASAIKTIACYEADRRDIVISLERHRIIHARYPTLMRQAVLARDIESLVPVKVLAAALAIAANRSRHLAEVFYQDIRAAFEGGLPPDTPAHRVAIALVDALLGVQRDAPPDTEAERERRDSANHAADRDQLKKFEWILLSWNRWVAGHEPQPLGEPAEERFPDVAYLPSAS